MHTDVRPTQITPRRLGGDVFAVAVTGELDLYSAPELEDAFAELSDGQIRLAVVDLVETTFVDSKAIGILLGARNTLAARGGGMVLVTETPTVELLLRLMGIADLFDLISLEPRAERPTLRAA